MSGEELYQPVVSALTALVILSACVGVILNCLVILGNIAGERNIPVKVLSVVGHVSAVLATAASSPMSLLHLHSASSLENVSNCIAVCTVQIIVVTVYASYVVFFNVLFKTESYRPGFVENHWNTIKVGLVLVGVLPVIILASLAGVFIQVDTPAVSGNGTNTLETCDWSVYPRWFPYLFVYGLTFPSVIILIVLNVTLLLFARRKSRSVEAQIKSVAQNRPQGDVATVRIKTLEKRRNKFLCLTGVNMLFIYAMFLTVTTLMLHCPTQWCHPVVLNCLWTLSSGIVVIIHAGNTLVMSPNVRNGIKLSFPKVFATK